MSLRSKFASSKYPNLFKYSPNSSWIFRKFSSEKKKEFVKSTGVTDNEAKAYREGLRLFNDWLGVHIDQKSGRELTITDIARAVLANKETKAKSTYRTSKNQLVRHILPAFGHLKPSQITSLKWDQFDSEERKKGQRVMLFNTRKALLEVLHRSQEEGLIVIVPRLKNHDPESRSGRYLDDSLVELILQFASVQTRLLSQILFRMGARPGEVIQWRWSMINWSEDDHGRIYIPSKITKTRRSRDIPLNSVVSALLKALKQNSSSDYIFPSPKDKTLPIKEYKTGWKSAVKRALCSKICGEECCGKCLDLDHDIHIYDLRHTWITNQAKRNVNPLFTAKYSDTSVAMIEKVYLKAERTAMQNVAN